MCEDGGGVVAYLGGVEGEGGSILGLVAYSGVGVVTYLGGVGSGQK